MSLNQSKAEKSEGQQLRKTGRSSSSSQHRGYSGGGGGGGGKGGGPAPPPQLSSSSWANHSLLSTNRSFKKSGNGQGGSSRANTSNSRASAAVAPAAPIALRAEQNGALVQPPLPGSSDAPASSAAKPVDVPISRNSQAHRRAPVSRSAAGASDSTAPMTPGKGDGSKAFTLQFGSISPGITDGMQIPARTTSAPPNLDEQKQDQILNSITQARHGSFRGMPKVPIPSGPQQPQQPKKDASGICQSNTGECLLPGQVKWDRHSQISAGPAIPLPKPSVLPIAGISMPMAFQQPHAPLQFSGPGPQLQSQGVASGSLQMPMTLPVGNVPHVPQQMLLHGLQSHPLQPQPMMHQGQGLGFAPQMGHQLPPQLGNLGISIATQPFAQQQPGKFGAPRKTTVKITHPDTHEELRLDKRADSCADGGFTGQRPLLNVTSQSQPVPPFTPSHYYPPLQPSAYNPSQMFFPSSTSLPLTSSQMSSASQAPRYNYPVGQSGQAISFMNPSVIKPMPGSKSGPPLHGLSEPLKVEAVPVSAPSAPVQGMVKPVVSSHGNKAGTASVTVPISNAEASRVSKPFGEAMASHPQQGSKISLESSVQQSKSASQQSQTTQASILSVPVAPRGDSGPVETVTDCRGKELVQRLDSFNNNQKNTSKKDLRHSQHLQQTDASESADGDVTRQLSRNSEKILEFSGSDMVTTAISLSSLSLEQCSSTEIRNSEAVESQLVSTKSELSGVNLVKEIPQDACLRADTGILVKDKGSFGTSYSMVLEMDETVPKNSYPTFSQDNSILLDVEPGQETHAEREHGESEVFSDSSRDTGNAKMYPISVFTECVEGRKPVDLVEQDGAGGDNSESSTICESYDAKGQQSGSYNEEVGQSLVVEKTTEESDISASTYADPTTEAEAISSSHLSSVIIEEKKPSSPGAITNSSKAIYSQDVGSIGPDVPQPETAPVTSKVTEKLEGKVTELSSEDIVSVLSSGPKEPSLEPPRGKPASGKKKKKREIYSKADAAGSSDLYNAYKGPEEKHETTSTTESVDSPVVVDAEKHVAADTNKDVVAREEGGPSKVEVDDWEDAADISTPKLRIPENGQQASRVNKNKDDDRNESTSRKYSRDFLLTFSEQCTDLPAGFEIRSDIADALMGVLVAASHVVDREPYPSPGRITERSPGVSRVERHMVGIVDDKWMKTSSSFASVRDIRPEIGHGVAVMNFRPGQGVAHGVLRHPRGQSPGQFSGGILSGPMQSLSSQGGMPRSGAEADRWQRSPGTQRGLIPSPQTPLQIMHKAEKKYEVGKVTDEEETKQRQLKAILNKLTPQNFEKLFKQVKEVNIDNTVTLTGVISQIFDKALMEPTFCEMYADFCYHLAIELPDFTEDNEKITFKRLLLNKCQEEFERGEREQAEADNAEGEGETQQSEEERDEKKIKARRRMLGNIRLIGELYKKRMLTERIMHECIKKLLGQYQNPDEEDIEALCKLMSTIGEMIDHPKAKEHMDAYFDMMAKLSTNQKLSSRVRFMLKDSIDLRKNKWQQRRKVERPKKIEEVHKDAAQERQAQASRSARGSGISAALRRGPSVDYGLRGATILPSPSSQVGNIHNLPPQVRGYGPQDIRSEDRHPFVSRMLSVPLPQRPTDDDSITLGPQGGLARGMSVRGQSLMSSVSVADISPSVNDHRRIPPGPNGYGRTPDWTPYSSKEEMMPKYVPERFSGARHDLMNPQDRDTYFGSRDKTLDRSFDRPAATILPSGHVQGSLSSSAGASSEAKQLSKEALREKSISAIREFYSANDEEEVTLCIKELNCPNFYPAMISLWVADSFERKDMERDLLATLLVNLCKSRDSLLNQVQLIQGFGSVLTLLEDAVNDAPRAAEFLGHIFAKVILENVVPLREIGKLIHRGGEDPGRLLELGLASEVLGSILEVIKMEKGEAILNEIHASSNLRLEDFRPPHPVKAKKLDAFL